MKKKISYKLILAVSSVTILIIGIFSYFIISSQQQALIHQVEDNAHQISETLKGSAKHDMLLNQREGVHHIIDTVGQQDGIEKIRIFNKEGEIIYSSEKQDIGTLVDKQAESCYVCHTADQPLSKLEISERTRFFKSKEGVKNLGIINPIYNEPACWSGACHVHDQSQKVLGVLDVTMSLEEVERQIKADQIRMLIFALSAILIISFILWFFVQKLVGRPVSRLVEATNIVATGDLDYKIEFLKNDELGHLGKSFNDMTQKLAEAQRQLYQSDKLASLGRLAAGIAHEINNPLTGVLTYSSLLLRHHADNDEIKNDLEVIVRETKRCREIVKGILNFARQVPSKRANISINDIVNQTLEILENELNLKNVTVNKQLTKDLPTIQVDVNQIQQVLINLFQNAADAIGRKEGEIKIFTDAATIEDKKYVCLKVIDTGCGISQQDLSTIFDPFYTTKGQQGTGLGLAVVWGIIEKHGGKIDVESGQGKGTTFTIHLPV